MGRNIAKLCRQQAADEIVMSLTEKECRSALMLLAHATSSLTAEDDPRDDAGLSFVQAAIAEDAARTAIRQVLAVTRGIRVASMVPRIRRRKPQRAEPANVRRLRSAPDSIA